LASEILRPTANSGSQGHTAVGAAANWDCCNETTANNDTDYVSNSATGAFQSKTDRHVISDVVNVSGTINWVKIWISAKWAFHDPGNANVLLAPRIRIGVTDYTGSVVNTALSSAYMLYSSQYNTNPATGAAWTPTTVNSIIGTIITTIDGTTTGGLEEARVTQVYIEVDYTPFYSPVVLAFLSVAPTVSIVDNVLATPVVLAFSSPAPTVSIVNTVLPTPVVLAFYMPAATVTLVDTEPPLIQSQIFEIDMLLSEIFDTEDLVSLSQDFSIDLNLSKIFSVDIVSVFSDTFDIHTIESEDF
jgi:hypothetical protein